MPITTTGSIVASQAVQTIRNDAYRAAIHRPASNAAVCERRRFKLRSRLSIAPMALASLLIAAAGCGDPTPSKLPDGSAGGGQTQGESSAPDSGSTTQNTDDSFTDTSGATSSTPESDASSAGSSSTGASTSESDSSPTTTSTDQDSSNGSDSSSDQEPLPRVRIQVKPGAQLCGLANDMGTTIKEGFSSKQKIYLDEGTFETNGMTFTGTLSQESKTTRFESNISSFKLREQPSGTRAFIGVQQPGSLEDGTPFKFGLTLSQWPDDEVPTYVVDDWTELAPNEDYNGVHITSSDPLDILGGNKRAMFGACGFPELEPETFAFDFPDGDRIEFVTKTRLLANRRQYQRGLLLSAKGSFRGAEIDVDDWEMLVYAAREHALSPRRPDLGVRFPETKGICGLWLTPRNPDGGKSPYIAFVLNCEHEKLETLEPTDWTIPPRFGKY